MVKFEGVIPYLGEFGKYQKIQVFLLNLPIWVTGMHALAFTFLGATPDFRCFIPGYDDFVNKTEPLNQSLAIPPKGDGYDSCKRYDINITNGVWVEYPKNTTIAFECEDFVYDRSQYKTSTVIEWNMVCDRSFMKNVAQSLYMAGMCIGAVVFGDLSDRFGRKKMMFSAQILQCVAGVLLAFAPEYITFCILRFLLGAAHSGVFLPAYCIGMEFIGHKGKVWTGISYHASFAIGFGTLALAAYFIPYWSYLQLTITAPGFIFLIYYWEKILPGSARWLLQNKRPEDSKRIIQKAAKVNKVILPQKVLDQLEPDVKHRASIIAMLKYPRMRRNAFIVFYNWFTVSFVYYGLSLNTSNLPGGNDYLNLTLSGLVEFPGFVFCLLMMDRYGRRPSLCLSMIFCGAAMIAVVFVPKGSGLEWLVITLAMTGKAFTGSSFTLVYNYSAELFPTVVRNSVVGVSSMTARIGGIVAPYVNLIGEYTDDRVPLVTFGACSLLAGLLALLLPETNKMPMAETLEQGENFGLKPKDSTESNGDAKADTGHDGPISMISIKKVDDLNSL